MKKKMKLKSLLKSKSFLKFKFFEKVEEKPILIDMLINDII